MSSRVQSRESMRYAPRRLVRCLEPTAICHDGILEVCATASC